MSIFSKVQFLIEAFFKFFSEALLSVILYKNIKVFLCNHFTLGILYLKRKKTVFPHPVGIVIGSKVELGENCIIYQNVTLGTKDTKNFKTAAYPRIGNNVTIYANSVIFGDITIGDNVIIGANSVVFENVPPNVVIGGNPAKVLRKPILQ